MPHFGPRSLEQYVTLHPDLQAVLEEAIKLFDFAILCGYRDEIEQAKAFLQGRSKLRWPDSRHNKKPSEAADLCPYPVDWADEDAFEGMAEVVLNCAKIVGVELVWGGTWPMRDLPHFELAKK